MVRKGSPVQVRLRALDHEWVSAFLERPHPVKPAPWKRYGSLHVLSRATEASVASSRRPSRPPEAHSPHVSVRQSISTGKLLGAVVEEPYPNLDRLDTKRPGRSVRCVEAKLGLGALLSRQLVSYIPRLGVFLDKPEVRVLLDHRSCWPAMCPGTTANRFDWERTSCHSRLDSWTRSPQSTCQHSHRKPATTRPPSIHSAFRSLRSREKASLNAMRASLDPSGGSGDSATRQP